MKWFSFKGRATRREWWMVTVFTFAAFVAAIIFFYLILSSLVSSDSVLGGTVGQLLIPWTFIVSLIAQYATSVRRYHDRAKSGWWVLIALIPFIGGIWQLVELGFLESVNENNPYGTSPLPAKEKPVNRITVGDLMSNS